jgi:hypothetical protein
MILVLWVFGKKAFAEDFGHRRQMNSTKTTLILHNRSHQIQAFAQIQVAI